MEEILIICLIGGIAGWLAGVIVNFESDSLLLDIVLGIIGGYLGYRLFGTKLNITSNIWINRVLTATVGAAILALGVKLIRRAFRS